MRDILKFGLLLGLVCGISAVTLSAVFSKVDPLIKENERLEAIKKRKMVLPEAAVFEPVELNGKTVYIGLDEGSNPPCIRRVDSNKDTRDFVDQEYEEHANGEIWSATLWDIRTALGRRTADQMIVESHYELDGFTTFARGARAILNADEHLNGATNRNALHNVFNARRIGPI